MKTKEKFLARIEQAFLITSLFIIAMVLGVIMGAILKNTFSIKTDLWIIATIQGGVLFLRMMEIYIEEISNQSN